MPKISTPTTSVPTKNTVIMNDTSSPVGRGSGKRKYILKPDHSVFPGTLHKESLSDQDVENELIELGKLHFGATKTNCLHWHRKAWKLRKKTSDRRRILYCAHNSDSACLFRLEIITCLETNLSTINIGNCPHSDHTVTTNNAVLPLVMKQYISSTTNLSDQPKKVVNDVRDQGYMVTSKASKQIKRHHYYCKKKHYTSHLSHGQDTTVGGLHNTFNLYKQENITNFCEHSVYLVGNDIFSKHNDNRIPAVLSTENLLLNAYR